MTPESKDIPGEQYIICFVYHENLPDQKIYTLQGPQPFNRKMLFEYNMGLTEENEKHYEGTYYFDKERDISGMGSLDVIDFFKRNSDFFGINQALRLTLKKELLPNPVDTYSDEELELPYRHVADNLRSVKAPSMQVGDKGLTIDS